MLKSITVTERRKYRQFCGVARALDRVGERWTLLVARNLLLGPKRYSELIEGLPGITTNLLAKRLREMTAFGLIEKRPKDLYALTQLGATLEPVIMELGRWGGRFLVDPRRDDRRNIGWALISMKRRYLGIPSSPTDERRERSEPPKAAGGAVAPASRGGLRPPFVIELQAGSRRFEVTLG